MADHTLSLDLPKFRQLRESLGLSMEQAATAAGFRSGRQFWYLLEGGERPDVPLSSVAEVAATPKCKPKDILK